MSKSESEQRQFMGVQLFGINPNMVYMFGVFVTKYKKDKLNNGGDVEVWVQLPKSSSVLYGEGYEYQFYAFELDSELLLQYLNAQGEKKVEKIYYPDQIEKLNSNSPKLIINLTGIKADTVHTIITFLDPKAIKKINQGDSIEYRYQYTKEQLQKLQKRIIPKQNNSANANKQPQIPKIVDSPKKFSYLDYIQNPRIKKQLESKQINQGK